MKFCSYRKRGLGVSAAKFGQFIDSVRSKATLQAGVAQGFRVRLTRCAAFTRITVNADPMYRAGHVVSSSFSLGSFSCCSTLGPESCFSPFSCALAPKPPRPGSKSVRYSSRTCCKVTKTLSRFSPDASWHGEMSTSRPQKLSYGAGGCK